jgi:hypothetical protein
MDNENQNNLFTLYVLDLIAKELSKNSTQMTRVKLRNTLKIDEDILNSALDLGVNDGILERGKQNFYTLKKDFIIKEEKFYPPIISAVKILWNSDKFDKNEFFIEETAKKDTKIVGPWTRPDFTLISCKKFSWTIGVEFDVVTFEVKRPDSCNVLAVFEALSHASAATRAYVVFPVDEKEWTKTETAQAARVKDECSRHGVGLILIENIYKKPIAKIVVGARKREIDHEKCNSFLEAVLSDCGRGKISAWKS